MDADVHAGAAAAERRVDEAGAGRQPIAPGGVDARVINFTQGPGIHPGLDRDGRLAETVMLRRHQGAVAFAQRLAHGEDFGGGDGEGLFAKDMLARLERADDRGRVDLVWRADIHGVDFIQLQQVVKIGEDLRDVEILCQFARRQFVDVAYGNDFRVGHGEPARFEMRAADDAAGAD